MRIGVAEGNVGAGKVGVGVAAGAGVNVVGVIVGMAAVLMLTGIVASTLGSGTALVEVAVGT